MSVIVRKLRDIQSVPGFEHQDIHINSEDMNCRANRWLKEHAADTPCCWKSSAGAAANRRREEFRMRARAIEAERRGNP
jgi:hypothetical protein